MESGLRRKDLKMCGLCGKGVMHDNNIMFHRITLERFLVDVGAVQRQHGLEMSMGGDAMAGIAQIMGPDEDLAKRVGEPDTAIICDECAMDMTCLAEIHERIAKDQGEPEQPEPKPIGA